MLSRKSISLILCAMVLISSCIVVTSNAEAKKMSDWSAPAPLQLAGNYLNASDPVVDMNENGDAIAAWTTYDSSSGSDLMSVSAAVFTDGSWGPVTTISAPGTSSAGPEIAMNDLGNALIVWQASNETFHYYLQATSYINGAWGAVENISEPVNEIRQFSIALNDNGNGSLVWYISESKESGLIMAAIYSEGTWSSAQTISNTTSLNTRPTMALSHVNGDVVAAWEQYEGGEDMLAAALYSNGVWGAPQNVTSSGANYYAPAVVIDSHGSVLLACERSDGNKNNITMIQYDPSTGSWISVHTYTDDRDLYSPAIMVNDWDNVVLGWMVDPDTNNYMNATVFVDGTWMPITQISTGFNDAYNLWLDINNNGKAVALWTEYNDPTYYVRASIFSNGAWSVADYVSEGYLDMPRVAMGGNGCAIAMWYTQDPILSTNSVYYSIYIPTPSVTITAPSEGSIITTDDVTVEWTGTNADYYMVSVNDGQPVNIDLETSIDLTDLEDGDYRVNVTVYNDAGKSSSRYVNFVVDTTAPEVRISNPLTDAWFNTTTLNVTWTATDPGSDIANMSVSMDGEPFVDVTTSYREFTSLADGQHTVFVRVYDNAGNFVTIGRAFNIDTELPVLNITEPDEDALIDSTEVQLVWTGSSASDIGRYWISLDNGEYIDVEQNTSYVLSGLAQGDHKVTLRALNYAGNWNTTSVNFTVDSVAPVVSITSPLDGTHTTERNVTVEWTVSESGSGLDSVEISIDGGSWSAVVGNSYALLNLTDGTHTIAVRATDVAGNSDMELVVLFVDNVAPTATISPSGDGIAIDTTIVVEFSDAMNETSVSIVVSGVTGTVSWNANVATFTPSSALSYNSEYTVTVSGKDLAGNNMTEMTSTFTTAKNECTISGIVKDADGNAVANATVALSNGMTATTDANGRFEFVGVPSGSYTLNVTKDGFQTLTQTVSAVAGQSTDLATLSIAKNASGSDGSDNTLWIVGIIGVVVVAILGIAFVMYRKKKA